MRLLPLAAALLALAACAEAPAVGPPPAPGPGTPGAPPRLADRGPPEGAPPRCARLFVSPAGEPFRAEPDASTCPLAAWFARADANGDGALSRTEFRDDALRFFATLDVNGDGLIDGAELQRYEHLIAPEILGRGGGPRAEAQPRLERAAYQFPGGGGGGMGGGGGGMGGGRGGHGGGRGGGASESAPAQVGGFGQGGLARAGLLDEPEPVAGADLDFDGRITRAEFATRADQRFASLDEAGEGRLRLATLEARLRAKMHAAPGGRRGGGDRSGGGGRGRRSGGGGPGGAGGPPG